MTPPSELEARARQHVAQAKVAYLAAATARRRENNDREAAKNAAKADTLHHMLPNPAA